MLFPVFVKVVGGYTLVAVYTDFDKMLSDFDKGMYPTVRVDGEEYPVEGSHHWEPWPNNRPLTEY